MFVEAIVLFAIALFLALMEIEVEGKFGWAEKIPTWYRTTGLAGRIWGLMMSGKPLTGYHLFLNGVLLTMLHFGFTLGLEWSLRVELLLIAKYFALAVFWDFLWFVFNPYYGISNYKKENVWWFSKSRWMFGIFPLDYLAGLGCSMIPAYFGGIVKQQLTLIGLLVGFTFLSIVVAPLYRRWYAFMRRRDDRNLAGIIHRLP